MIHKNWTDEEVKEIERCESYGEMKEIALRKLKHMPQPVVQVCGPIATGGKGSFDANIEMIYKGIQHLELQGKNVFDQLPFEPKMQILKLRRTEPGYAYEILDEFYLPLFKSGLISGLYFLPDWESSTGARWEHDRAEEFKIPIFYFSNNELES